MVYANIICLTGIGSDGGPSPTSFFASSIKLYSVSASGRYSIVTLPLEKVVTSIYVFPPSIEYLYPVIADPLSATGTNEIP